MHPSPASLGTSPVRYRIHRDVAYITLDAPPLNILTVSMMDRLCSALEAIHRDSTIKALALTATGRAFSAGAHLEEHHPEAAPAMMDTLSRLYSLFDRLDIPVIALVDGPALGGGFELALMAHTLLATDKASFGHPEIHYGFFAPVALAVLPERVGIARAIEIITSGHRYTADEAARFGLVSRVVASESAEAELESCLDEFRQASPLIQRMAIRTLKRVARLPFEEARQLAEGVFLDELMATSDVMEGLAAFAEKRRPVWMNTVRPEGPAHPH